MRILNILQYLWNQVAKFFKNSTTQKVLGVFIFFTITILILFSNFNPNQVMLRPDEVAQRNIQSNINVVIIDEKQTDELKRQAVSKVQKVYQQDNFARVNTEDDINDFYTRIDEIIGLEEEQDTQIEKLLLSIKNPERKISSNFNEKQLAKYVVNATPEDLEQMRQTSISVVRGIMNKPITEEALEEVLIQVQTETDSLEYSAQAKEIMKLVAVNAVRPNLIFNKEATDKAIKEAMDDVQPVQKTIKAGEIIVREGDRVTETQISTLEQLGIQRTKSYPLTLAGTALFVLLTFWLVIEFLRRYYKHVYETDRLMLLIGLIFLLILLLTRFLTIIKIGDQPEIHRMLGYLAPVAAGSMLIAILLDNRLAYFLTMIMALYVGLLSDGNQLFFAITAFVGGSVGVFQVYRLNQTSDLARSGLYVALANIASIITLTLIEGNINLTVLSVGMILGAVNGILSAVLMIGALPYLETTFSITSMIKLLELSNPNHELLKRELLEAPGTYHHSLMVGNLAEASAESIGANPLLVRVGAYYHDIGKVKRPEYFVENQRGFENPHEKIAPALSALIITSHVKEGVELAREAHLPQVIIDFIEQHHGTGLAKYFYSRALEEDREGIISEESFRYEGPKPQSKEVALVMLADSVEAAVRSLDAPTQTKIESMVRKIIRDKLNDGQLELCDLTFKDLDTIARSFCKILEGIYHKRIEYPETIVKEFEKRRENDGNYDNQPAEHD
ncbi:MAG: HDIG domain-containing protein [Syntrophomonadaceae bacterium]|nr:HDIG domain-containing protein [Syntrophomonadaceae bacterium]